MRVAEVTKYANWEAGPWVTSRCTGVASAAEKEPEAAILASRPVEFGLAGSQP